MNTAHMETLLNDPRQVAIIRQSMLKASADFMSGKLASSDIRECSEKVIKLAKEFEHYVYHGEPRIEIPDIDLKKYIKTEEKENG